MAVILPAARRNRKQLNYIDRIACEAGEMHTLTGQDMYRILDSECRDRHLWTLASHGLRRGETLPMPDEVVDVLRAAARDKPKSD
jgi:integrase